MQRVKLLDLFSITSSIQDDKKNFDEADINDIDALPFVSRTGRNNGVTGYCSPRDNMRNEGGVLTLALDGSTGATFYQHHEYLSGQNIWVLKPKTAMTGELTPLIALYMTASIRKSVEAYTYNLSLTKTRLEKIQLQVPLRADGTLNREFITETMSKVRHIDLINELPSERYQILT